MAHLPTALAALPGGGIGHGTSFQVTDQAQDMDLHFYVVHQAGILYRDWSCCKLSTASAAG